MRRRSVIYASLIAVAIVFGLVAAGLPSHRNDAKLRVPASVPTTVVSLPGVSPTTATIVAPTIPAP